MLLDAILVFLCILAIWKGTQKGLVLALFSFAGIFIGIAAALKMSTLVARWLSASVHVNGFWLPFLAFLIIILAVGLLVRMGAKIVETLLDLSLLGWVNKLAGVFIFALLYFMLFSILIFYAEKMDLLKPQTIAASISYPWLHKVGPLAISFFAELIPLFKGMFAELSHFFDGLNKQLLPITTFSKS
ncbi:MAG: CvpA family protein [Chitinophagaceae bacterium]|nr:CvpA family protein [Chitinophagaceae bacterium]